MPMYTGSGDLGLLVEGLYPFQDTALQVAHIAETRAKHHVLCSGAPTPGTAIHNDFIVLKIG